jgi:hypothetical protein
MTHLLQYHDNSGSIAGNRCIIRRYFKPSSNILFDNIGAQIVDKHPRIGGVFHVD